MIVIVLGMHRSGTSTIAGILHLNNILMGTYQNFWPRPLRQNPKGFYENYDFRKINDMILKKHNYDVKSYNSNIPMVNLNESLTFKMIKLLKKYSKKYSSWGWKDPRTCLTIFKWYEVMKFLDLKDQLKIVYVSRNASSVARSLNKRNNLEIGKGLALWAEYSKRALDFCETINVPVFYCSFEHLLKSPEKACSPLFKFLNREMDINVLNSFVDKKISKNSIGTNFNLPKSISKLENRINDLVSK